MEARTAIRCGMCGDTKLQNGEPCPQCTLGMCDYGTIGANSHDIPHPRYVNCINWKASRDTAKEQAGRKMFEALETIEAEISHGTDAEKCPNCIVKAALAAGREAGWGQ